LLLLAGKALPLARIQFGILKTIDLDWLESGSWTAAGEGKTGQSQSIDRTVFSPSIFTI